MSFTRNMLSFTIILLSSRAQCILVSFVRPNPVGSSLDHMIHFHSQPAPQNHRKKRWRLKQRCVCCVVCECFETLAGVFREPNDGAVFVPNFLCAPRRRLLQTWLKHTLQSESYGILVKWILKKCSCWKTKPFFGTVREPKDWFLIQGSAAMATQSHAPRVRKKAKSAPFLCLSQLAETSSDMLCATERFFLATPLTESNGGRNREKSAVC